jgi:serine/threonine protein kinase
MHHAGFLHRDIKPNNFVMGLPGTSDENKVFILDFGLSKPYQQDGNHFPMLPLGKSLTGTARYASVNSHYGFSKERFLVLHSNSFKSQG